MGWYYGSVRRKQGKIAGIEKRNENLVSRTSVRGYDRLVFEDPKFAGHIHCT